MWEAITSGQLVLPKGIICCQLVLKEGMSSQADDATWYQQHSAGDDRRYYQRLVGNARRYHQQSSADAIRYHQQPSGDARIYHLVWTVKRGLPFEALNLPLTVDMSSDCKIGINEWLRHVRDVEIDEEDPLSLTVEGMESCLSKLDQVGERCLVMKMDFYMLLANNEQPMLSAY